MKQTVILKRMLFVFAFCVAAVFVKAQGDPGDPFGGDPGGTPSTAVPLDGGLSLLLGAGVAYGVKKGFDSRKRK